MEGLIVKVKVEDGLPKKYGPYAVILSNGIIGSANFNCGRFYGGVVHLYPLSTVTHWLKDFDLHGESIHYALKGALLDLIECDISQQTFDALKRAGYNYLFEVIMAGESKLLECRNIGPKRISEINRFLKTRSLKLYK